MGIGAAFLKARHVTMVECDPITVDALQSNIRDVDGTSMCTIIEAMVDGTALNLEQPVDMVIMNPPWGVQTQRADRVFFETIFAIGDVVPALHIVLGGAGSLLRCGTVSTAAGAPLGTRRLVQGASLGMLHWNW